MKFAVEAAPADNEPKFNPFTGVARRLDGKPLQYQPPPASTSTSRDKKPLIAGGNGRASAGSIPQSSARQAQGKLVFGSNANHGTPKEKQKVL